MKATQTKPVPEFIPVVLTIESAEELVALRFMALAISRDRTAAEAVASQARGGGNGDDSPRTSLAAIQNRAEDLYRAITGEITL